MPLLTVAHSSIKNFVAQFPGVITGGAAQSSDGPTYSISAFQFELVIAQTRISWDSQTNRLFQIDSVAAFEVPDELQRDFQEWLANSMPAVVLGSTSTGFVAWRSGLRKTQKFIPTTQSDTSEAYYASAIQAILTETVSALRTADVRNVYVSPHSEDCDASNGRDLRSDLRSEMRIQVLVSEPGAMEIQRALYGRSIAE
jgi:hypothetical protein